MSAAADPDLVLFADTLSCDDEFPLVLNVVETTSGQVASRAEAMLRTFALMEESSGEDAETHGGDPAIVRLESKLDLALGLLAGLVTRHHPPPPPMALRWSRRGMRLIHPVALVPGTSALVSVYLLAALPLPLELPVEVLACEQDTTAVRLWLQFPDHEPALQAGIERQLFRRHRRLIAESKRRR